MLFRLLSIALAAWPCLAAAAPLGFDEAIAAALKNQPLIESQQALLNATLAEQSTALQLPDPKLKFGIINLPTSNFSLTDDFMTMRSISIEQSVPRAEKRQLRGERYRIEAEINSVELENVQRTVRRDVGLAWLNYYGAARAVELVEEQLRLGGRSRQAMEIGLAANQRSLHDVRRSDVDLALLEDRLLEARGQLSKARAELARWVGLWEERQGEAALPVFADPLPLERLRKTVHQHPQLVVARREITLAENEVAQAAAARLPDWSFEVGYAKRGPAYSDMVSAQVSIDLPIAPAKRQDRLTAAKQQMLERHLRLHDDHERRLRAELATVYAEWESAKQRAERFTQDLLPHAAQRVGAALAEYRSAKGDLAVVLEAQRAEVEARMQLIALQVAAAKARVQLQYLTE